jgi:hypothetical protein
MRAMALALAFQFGAIWARRAQRGSVGEFSWLGACHSIYWVVVYLSQLIPADSINDHVKLRNLIYQAVIG